MVRFGTEALIGAGMMGKVRAPAWSRAAGICASCNGRGSRKDAYPHQVFTVTYFTCGGGSDRTRSWQ